MVIFSFFFVKIFCYFFVSIFIANEKERMEMKGIILQKANLEREAQETVNSENWFQVTFLENEEREDRDEDIEPATAGVKLVVQGKSK